jgi:hypothetical protein
MFIERSLSLKVVELSGVSVSLKKQEFFIQVDCYQHFWVTYLDHLHNGRQDIAGSSFRNVGNDIVGYKALHLRRHFHSHHQKKKTLKSPSTKNLLKRISLVNTVQLREQTSKIHHNSNLTHKFYGLIRGNLLTFSRINYRAQFGYR